jgi:hypothetical protein
LPAPTLSPTEPAAADVILRDGSTLRLRAPAPEEAGALQAFFAGLSAHSAWMPNCNATCHTACRVGRTRVVSWSSAM